MLYDAALHIVLYYNAEWRCVVQSGDAGKCGNGSVSGGHAVLPDRKKGQAVRQVLRGLGENEWRM